MKHVLVAMLLLVALVEVAEAKRKKGDPTEAAAVASAGETQRKALAQKLVGDARIQFDKGVFDDAAKKFEEAYRLFPVPKMLYNLGLSYEALHKTGRMQCAFERFLSEAPDADPDLRKEAEQKVAEQRGRMGRIDVVAPAGAVLFIDAEEQAVAPLTRELCVEQGKHRVVALVTGVAPVGLDVSVAPAATTRLVLDPTSGTARLMSTPQAGVQPIAPAETSQTTTLTTTKNEASPVARKPIGKAWWLWTAVGVVVVGGVSAGLAVGLSPSHVMPPSADFGPFPVLSK